MFVGLSSWLLPIAIAKLFGAAIVLDQSLSAALLLNIALILLIWRGSHVLSRQTKVADDAQREVEIVAVKDYATGLLNRPGIAEKIEQKLQYGENLSLINLDLDNFKKINDLYGHQAGDELLMAVAERLLLVTPASSACARLGGDEFAILLFGKAAKRKTALAIAKQIQNALAEPVEIGGGITTVSASIGIYVQVEGSSSIADVFRRSDIAMYQAKKAGGERISCFEDIMEAEVQKRYKMEAEIREGIPEGEFVPFYQPQYGIRGSNLLGFEVLARWNHPDGMLIEPIEFISLAESTGLISPLSFSVMRQALIDAKDWDHSLTLAVNISPVQLSDPSLDKQIMKLLVETGFPPQRLELEITESSLLEDTPLVLSTITSLKALGIRISLDDFGTGYSSMTQLKAFPFDRIKIDRSFVFSMLDNEESAAIVNSIASLAASLNVPITAEGIESDEMRAYLDNMGCSDGQGWLYGRPISKDELIKLLPQIALSAGNNNIQNVKAAIEPDSAQNNLENEQRISNKASR
ncbi:putative bifunctional diguanylate cyclase/phosphodiesterase [Parasphingorhabdus sp.]|uniref:putative bifunctional diguanylate cyclase/phosphodiesterase n=1 Tax=Parasphingorhabdus sp. TaxID=2709688 RepID=UPI003C7495C0